MKYDVKICEAPKYKKPFTVDEYIKMSRKAKNRSLNHVFLSLKEENKARKYGYLYESMRRYNFLISPWDGSFKWATEKLMELEPDTITPFGDTYENIYKSIMDDPNVVGYTYKELKKIHIKAGMYGRNPELVGRFDYTPIDSNEFSSVCNKQNEIEHDLGQITRRLWGCKIEDKEWPDSLDGEDRFNTSPEETAANYEECKRTGKKFHWLTKDTKFLYDILEIRYYLNDPLKHVYDKRLTDEEEFEISYGIYQDKEKFEALKLLALHRYWNAAAYFLKEGRELMDIYKRMLKDANNSIKTNLLTVYSYGRIRACHPYKFSFTLDDNFFKNVESEKIKHYGRVIGCTLHEYSDKKAREYMEKFFPKKYWEQIWEEGQEELKRIEAKYGPRWVTAHQSNL